MGLDIYSYRIVKETEIGEIGLSSEDFTTLSPNLTDRTINETAFFEHFKEYVFNRDLRYINVLETFHHHNISLEDVDKEKMGSYTQYISFPTDEYGVEHECNMTVRLKTGKKVKIKAENFIFTSLATPTIASFIPEGHFYQRKGLNGTWGEVMKRFGHDIKNGQWVEYLFTQEMVNVAGTCVENPYPGCLRDVILKPNEYIHLSY